MRASQPHPGALPSGEGNPWTERTIHVGLFFVPLAIYLRTMQPSISWADSGIFATAAACWGIPNAPGFPGYLHLAALFAQLPFGEPAWRVHLLSALCASGCVVVLYRIGLRVLGAGASRAVDQAAAATAALSFGFGYGLWSQAINSETFTYTTFFILLAFLQLLRLDGVLASTPALERRLHGAALSRFAAGVACAVAAGGGHPISSVILAPCLAVAYRHRAVLGRDLPRFGLVVGAAAAAFALLYLSQMYVARRLPPLSFGEPVTLGSLWIHVIAYYGGTVGLLGPIDPPRGAVPLLGYLLTHAGASMTPVLLLAALWGGWRLAQTRTWLFVLTATLPVAVWGANILQITSNLEHTFLSAEAAFCVWVAEAARAGYVYATGLARRIPRWAPALLLLVPLFVCVRWFPTLDRSKHRFPEEFGRNLLESLPERSILVSRGDLVAAATDYLQIAKGFREDVGVATTTVFLTQRWNREQFRRRWPDVDLRGVEAVLAANPLDAAGALAALVRDNYGRRPIFFMPTVSRELTLAPPFRLIPHGLAMRVSDKDAPIAVEAYRFRFADPEFPKHAPRYLELAYRMGWIGMLSQYAQAYENLRAAAGASGQDEIARQAASASFAFQAAFQTDLSRLVARYPRRHSGPGDPAFGVQGRR